MKISCPACAAKYSIADEKVQDRLAKIRCRKCGATIVIDGKVNPPNVYAAEGSAADHANLASAASPEPSREYSVDYGDNDQRTLPLSEVIAAYNRGEINADTFLWAEGMSDWKPLGEITEVVDALHAASASDAGAAIPISTAAASATSSPWDAPSPSPAPAPAAVKAPRESDAAIARAAARKDASRGPTADLFGSFEPSDEVATSAPHPDGSASGARNESSVLFSLSALTASAKPSPPAAAAAPATSASSSQREDSGLIDLRALTAAAPKQAAPEAEPLMAAPLGMSPLGVSPLGVSPLGGSPLGSPLGMSSPLGGTEAQFAPPKSNKTGLFIGAGIVVAALVVSLALILRPSAPEPTVPSATAEQPRNAKETSPAPQEQAPAVTAKPPATGVAEENGAPDAGAQKAAPRTYTGHASRSTPKKGSEESKSSGSSPAPDKKPAPKRSACGCAPGDLQCAMRCAAGK